MSRRRGFTVVLTIVSVIFALAIAEIGLRTYHRVRYGIAFFTSLPMSREARFQRSPFLVFGPRVNWTVEDRTGNPAWARFDEVGIRLPGPVPAREPGEVRILVLGGSTAENVWNELGIHWPLGLECLLRDEGRQEVRLLNAGMSAFTTEHSLVRYQFDLVDTHPDIVLIMHNVNDLTVTYHAAARGVQIDPNYLVKYGIRDYTGEIDDSDIVFFRVGHALKSRLFPEAPTLLSPERWEYDRHVSEDLFRRNLRLLVHSIEDSGATPVLLTMPRSSDREWLDLVHESGSAGPGLTLLPEAERFFADFDSFNQVVRDLAEAEGLVLVDMARLLDEDSDTFVDMVHYSTDGIRTFSRTLYGQAVRFLPPPTGAVLDRSTRVPCGGVF